jgi:hypothetical protein
MPYPVIEAASMIASYTAGGDLGERPPTCPEQRQPACGLAGDHVHRKIARCTADGASAGVVADGLNLGRQARYGWRSPPGVASRTASRAARAATPKGGRPPEETTARVVRCRQQLASCLTALPARSAGKEIS